MKRRMGEKVARERACAPLSERVNERGLLLHPLALSDILLETTPDRRARRVNKACLHMYLAYRYIDGDVLETRAQGRRGTLSCLRFASLLLLALVALFFLGGL